VDRLTREHEETEREELRIQEEAEEEFERDMLGENSPKKLAERLGRVSLEEVLEVLQQEKAKELFVVDASKKCSFTQHLICATGLSARHMRAMAELLETKFKHRIKFHAGLNRPVEGRKSEDWIAVNFGNVIVNIFSEKGREYYDLEKLWALRHTEAPLDMDIYWEDPPDDIYDDDEDDKPYQSPHKSKKGK